ncbi:hypothetical protein HDU85_005059 [Gaertneriomyces sp. JEL0708]|nr:hypothetical protein HDU85_005059 [Gaertneriomyces sp. JEL0708]
MSKGDICVNVEYHSPEGIERYSAYLDKASVVADVITFITDKYGNDVDVILMSASDGREMVVNMSDRLAAVPSAGPLIVRVKKKYTPDPPPYMDEVLVIHPVREEHAGLNASAPSQGNVDEATLPAAVSTVGSTTTHVDEDGYKQPSRSKRTIPHKIVSAFLLGGVILFIVIFMLVKKFNKSEEPTVASEKIPTGVPENIPTISMTNRLDIPVGRYEYSGGLTYSDGLLYVVNNDTITAYSVTTNAPMMAYKARNCPSFRDPYVYKEVGLSFLGATCYNYDRYLVEWDLPTGTMDFQTFVRGLLAQGVRMNTSSIAVVTYDGIAIMKDRVIGPELYAFPDEGSRGRNIAYHKGTNTIYATSSFRMAAYNMTSGTTNFVTDTYTDSGSVILGLHNMKPSSDGTWVAAIVGCCNIIQWTSTGTLVRRYGNPSTEYRSFYITKDSQHFIIGSRDKKLTTFSATDGAVINQLSIDIVPDILIETADDTFYVTQYDHPHVYEYKYG